MSSTGTIEREVVCPCGQGAIVTEWIKEDDWRSTDHESDRIACSACSSKYRLVENYTGAGYALVLIEESKERARHFGRLADLRNLIHRDYCRPVIARLIELARERKGTQGKRKAWHSVLSRWGEALRLPPAEGTWMLERLLERSVDLANVRGIAMDLGLVEGLDAHLGEVAALEEALRSKPVELIWNGPENGATP